MWKPYRRVRQDISFPHLSLSDSFFTFTATQLFKSLWSLLRGGEGKKKKKRETDLCRRERREWRNVFRNSFTEALRAFTPGQEVLWKQSNVLRFFYLCMFTPSRCFSINTFGNADVTYYRHPPLPPCYLSNYKVHMTATAKSTLGNSIHCW